MKREFLQLAHTFKGNEPIGGWYCSEKLDGCRAFWDGGITRGRPCTAVPFANTTKDGRYINLQYSTGLWSRYGKAIQAPSWWLDKLPPYPIDGELYAGRGQFQRLMSTVKTLEPGPGWHDVKYMAFDSPPLRAIFANGEINNVNFKKTFTNVIAKLGGLSSGPRPEHWGFHNVYKWLLSRDDGNKFYRVHEQHSLPSRSDDALEEVHKRLDEIIKLGGEGLMLRNPVSFWAPQRTMTLLKVKPEQDAEGEVVGYVWGRETDRGSKLLGLMGALILNFQGKRLELSGFSEDERVMCAYEGTDLAAAEGRLRPGEKASNKVYNPLFPIGSMVSFKYRELSDSGIPKEARYWRCYDPT